MHGNSMWRVMVCTVTLALGLSACAGDQLTGPSPDPSGPTPMAPRHVGYAPTADELERCPSFDAAGAYLLVGPVAKNVGVIGSNTWWDFRFTVCYYESSNLDMSFMYGCDSFHLCEVREEQKDYLPYGQRRIVTVRMWAGNAPYPGWDESVWLSVGAGGNSAAGYYIYQLSS